MAIFSILISQFCRNPVNDPNKSAIWLLLLFVCLFVCLLSVVVVFCFFVVVLVVVVDVAAIIAIWATGVM